MIDSSLSNVAAAANRQDTRSLQAQREANEAQVAEQASSQPMAASGVEAANNLETRVSSQPAGVVTRLGETSEQPQLYESNRPSGTIIRPSIELAQNARANAETQVEANQQQANNRVAEDNFTEQQLAAAKTTPTRNDTPSTEDVQNLSS